MTDIIDKVVRASIEGHDKIRLPAGKRSARRELMDRPATDAGRHVAARVKAGAQGAAA